MKKHIILTAVFLLCLCHLKAQPGVGVSASIAEKFAAQFSGAERIEWNHAGNVAFARFRLNDQTWVVYYDEEHNLVATARQIGEIQHLPLLVNRSLQEYRQQQSAKSGPFELGPIFELNQDGATRYLVCMAGNGRQITFTIDSGGGRLILSKEKITPGQAATGADQLIARKTRRN